MENLVPSSGALPLVRPILALQGDQSALLREGRVVSGEVLQRFDGGTYVVLVAGERVPAESPSDLEVGESRRFEVVRTPAGLVLRPVAEAARASTSPLLMALRSLSAVDPAAEEALDALAELLRRADPRVGSRAERLLQLLSARLWDPARGAEGWRALIEHRTAGSAAALLAAFAELGFDPPAKGFASYASGLAVRLALALQQSGRQSSAFEGGALESLLGAALSRALAALSPPETQAALDREGLRQWSAALHGELVRALRKLGRDGSGEILARTLEELGGGVLLEQGELPFLRLLYQAHDGSGSNAWQRRLRLLAMNGFEDDLEGLLLGLFAELPGGELGDASLEALRSIELEQLLRLARHEAGEPAHYVFLVPDGTTRARVDLAVEHRTSEGGGREGEESWRLSLSVDFRSLGPVRADLLLRQRSLALRLQATLPETLELLRAAEPQLAQSLGALGRELCLSIVEAPPDAPDLASEARDVRILRDHHLMDVRG